MGCLLRVHPGRRDFSISKESASLEILNSLFGRYTEVNGNKSLLVLNTFPPYISFISGYQ